MQPSETSAADPIGQRETRNAGPRPVDTLNRFLETQVQETWGELDRALRITEALPEFSGILPLGDPSLAPYLEKPGIFFILGPAPRLSLLQIGASRGPVGLVLRSRIERLPDGGWVWRWEKGSDPPPTFAAIATMEEYWAFAPPLRNLLARRLGAPEEKGGTGSPDATGGAPLI